MDSDRQGYIAFSEVCDDLGITPAQLRDILTTFGDVVGAALCEGAGDAPEEEEAGGEPPWKALLEEDWRPGVEDLDVPPGEPSGEPAAGQEGGARDLPANSVALIARIVKLRAEGATDDQIRAAISGGEDPAGAAGRLGSALERLARELEQTEKRRAEDRDRLLTALMRTHQEVRQLRNELAAQTSRKSRKRKSLFSKLFGI